MGNIELDYRRYISRLPAPSVRAENVKAMKATVDRFLAARAGRRKLATTALACAAAALLFPLPGACQLGQSRSPEYDVKAAYLFNFGKFMRVSGTPPPASTFDLCILGRDPMGTAIDEIAANETIDDRPVRVVRIEDASRGRSCRILFIASSEDAQLREDLAVLAGSDVLTVSDAPDFLDRGGMIQFIVQQDRVRFEVNLDAVNRTHLVLSSELLRVAWYVKGRSSPQVQP